MVLDPIAPTGLAHVRRPAARAQSLAWHRPLANEDTATHRPLTYQVLDNLGEATEQDRYDADRASINGYTNGVPNPPADATRLRGKVLTSYDDQGRPFQATVYNVGTDGTYAT